MRRRRRQAGKGASLRSALRIAAGAVVILAWSWLPSPPCRASEAQLEDEPPPETAEEVKGNFENAFEEPVRKRPLFPWLRRYLQDLPPFLRDTELLVNLRTYYFNRRNVDDTRQAAFAAGGWLAYKSGWWKDHFQIGATVHTSRRLWGPQSKDLSLLLRPGQQSFAVVGEAFAKLRFDGHTLIGWRQSLDLPYLNRRDNRMVPNTFSGVTLFGDWSRVDYVVGHLFEIKPRAENRFISFSEQAGAPGTGKELSFGGFRFQLLEGLEFGAVDYFVPDTLNTFYAEANWNYELSDSVGLKLQAQFTDQRSVGSDLITGSSFDTRVFGGRATLGWRGLLFDVAFSSTANDARILAPWGSYPGYLGRMRFDYNRAGEDAWGVGLSWRVPPAWVDGLSFVVNYTRGVDAKDDGVFGDGDTDEWNLTVDYRRDRGWLQNFWLRIRGGIADRNGEDKDNKEVRVILNYELPIF